MKTHTKRKIQNGLIELLEDYSFQEISTKMICAYCGINRSTFYDYYQDKYDLLDTINQYHLDRYRKLLQILHNNFDNIKKNGLELYKFFIIITKYIKRNEAFFKAVFISHPIKDIFLDYAHLTRKHYEDIANEYSTLVSNKSLFVTYMIGGQGGVFLNWLSNHCQESPQEVANILLASTIKLQK